MKKITKRVLALMLACLLILPVLAGCQREQEEVVGIEKVQINKNGELVITYTDGTKDNLGVIVGADGKDGEDGTDGENGQNGTGSSMRTAVATALRSSVSVYCTGSRVDGYSAGSGVIYRLDKEQGEAFIITNYHVVYSKEAGTKNGIWEDIEVYLYGGQLEGLELKAEYVGGSQNYDIAVLHVTDSDVLRQSHAAAVTVADSDLVLPGQTAIAVGNAEGEGIAATAGIVSVDSEHITMTSADETTQVDHRVMRIDTAVNHGNSGGGLFNDQGQLIGIVNAKIIDEDVESIGYAIPGRVAIGAAQNIIDYCYGTQCETVMRPMLGITIINSDSRGVYDEATGLMHIEQTVSVHEVSRTSPVKGQIMVDDVLLAISINGEKREITRQHHVIDYMLWARVGDTVELTVLRDSQELTFSFTITDDYLTAY